LRWSLARSRRLRPGSQVDQEIDIAARIGVASCHGTKDTHIAGSAVGDKPHDFIPTDVAEFLERHDSTIIVTDKFRLNSSPKFTTKVGKQRDLLAAMRAACRARRFGCLPGDVE
jgi:hypothetical protein